MASEKPEPRLVVGPILHFQGEDGDRWRLSALFVLEGPTEPDDLMVDGVLLPVPPRHVFVWRGRHVWRFVFSVPRDAQDRRIGYGFPDRGTRWTLTVPGRSTRVRLAYTASNGVHDDEEVASLPNGASGMWKPLLLQHTDQPYHLLLQGGDQLHADNLWRSCNTLAEWWARPAAERFTKPFTRAMASIPSLMMWDDHDIFDGWGSRPDPEHHCQVYRGLFAVARRQYALFQLGASIRDPLDHLWGGGQGTFTQGVRIGDVGILALDLRSERSRTEVLGPATWQEMPGWLTRFAGCKHLLLMSCVPLAFVNLGWLEGLVNRFRPRAHASDQLRDQWRSPGHHEEWLRLLRQLTNFSLRYRCRITVLSGEVHLGAAASIHGGGVDLWQLISSGVVHRPLGRLRTWALRRMLKAKERVADDMTLEMPRFAETHKRFIRARTYLSLGFDRQNRLLVRWHSEQAPNPLELVI